jgi:uncharacterized protein
MSKKRQFPLMQKATAVWLIDNTTLTFKQISDFCGIHELEIKGIADGEVAVGIIGVNPIVSGQLDKSEIERCSRDASAKLVLKKGGAYEVATKKAKNRANYTPIARRQDKPDTIFWLIKNFPDIKDSTIIKLIGTTKPTIESIRNRSHWNMSNLRQRDPVLLGICTQVDLDEAIEKDMKDHNETAAVLQTKN